MKIQGVFVVAMILAATTGCVTTKEWSATGGSRADGVVRLSYEVGAMEQAQLSESQAIAMATRRCATWGYTGAEAFGGTTRQCNQPGGFGGCATWVVTKEFQCTGTGAPQAAGGNTVIVSPVVTASAGPSAAPAQPAASEPGYEAALRHAAARGCSAAGISHVSGNVFRANCPATGRSLILQCQGATCKEVD